MSGTQEGEGSRELLGLLYILQNICLGFCHHLLGRLMSGLTLSYSDPSCPYTLDCDASTEGVGAVFSQLQVEQERLVAY